MACICGSFQCNCQEKCTCLALDCHCEICKELRINKPLASKESQLKISPTRGATTSFSNLQISDNESTSNTLNYPSPKLLFPGRTFSKSPTNTQIGRDIWSRSSPDSPKRLSPKRKITSTNEEPQTQSIKRYSPYKDNRSDESSPTLSTGACPPDSETLLQRERYTVDKNNSSDPNTNASATQTATPDTNNPQEVPSFGDSLQEFQSTCNTIDSSSENKNSAMPKRIDLSIDPKHTLYPDAAEGFTFDKKSTSTQSTNKHPNNRNLLTVPYKKVNKVETPKKWESAEVQYDSEKSLKSKQLLDESSENSGVSSSTDRSTEPDSSARLSSNVQLTVERAPTDILESSEQASSKQSSSCLQRPVAPTGRDSNDIEELYLNLSLRWVADEDEESYFAPHERNLRPADSSTDSVSRSERETGNPSVTNRERIFFERSDSEVSSSSENQVVPD